MAHFSGRIHLQEIYVRQFLNAIFAFFACAQLLPQELVIPVHPSQARIDASRRIEASYCKVATRSIAVHSAMLDRCVLLCSFRISAVEETNDIGNCHAAIKRLASNVNVEWTALPQLARVVKQKSQLII